MIHEITLINQINKLSTKSSILRGELFQHYIISTVDCLRILCNNNTNIGYKPITGRVNYSLFVDLRYAFDLM